MALAVSGRDVRAQGRRIDAAPLGTLEVGAPTFFISEHESLGLDSAPTDIRMLPDGQVVAFGPRQLSIGDGARWHTFRHADNDPLTPGYSFAVDRDGTIYTSIPGGFARIDFGGDGQWRLKPVAFWPAENTAIEQPRAHDLTEVGGEWYWRGGGLTINWRPGSPARVLARGQTIEQVFRFHDDVYLSDSAKGGLLRLVDGKIERAALSGTAVPAETITCASLFGPDSLLVGTYDRGLGIFDGKTLKPLPTQGISRSDARVNDLCRTADGGYAAAIDDVGIVVIDRNGRTLQVLDRAFDHRLMHVRHLQPMPGGVILGLLSDGILRVELPSQVSHFETFIGGGVPNVQPDRLGGKLWLLGGGSL